jgi:IS5 family transposase
MKQARLKLNLKPYKTRNQMLLDPMGQVVTRAALVELIALYHPEGKTGRQPFSLHTMLRVHFMQRCSMLSYPGMEQAFFDTALYRQFAQQVILALGLEELSSMPEESTILWFGKTPRSRHRLEMCKLAEQILCVVNNILIPRGLLLKTETVGNASLLHGEENHAFGNAQYQNIEKHPDAKADFIWQVAMPSCARRIWNKAKTVDARIDQGGKIKAGIQAKVEHPLRVIKRQFGYVKARNRGVKKDTTPLATLFARSNLWMVCGQLMEVRG